MRSFIEKTIHIIENKKAVYMSIALILLAIYIFGICPVAMQNDVFWSIEVGEKLLNEEIFKIDTFSIHEGLQYVAHHFLTDIAIYLVYNIWGMLGLYLFEILLTCIMAALIYYLNKTICNNRFVAYFLLFAQLVLLKPYIAVRAQMISFIIFIIELILLEKYSKVQKKRYFIGLLILPVVLANFHMGVVPFYFILLGVYGIGCFKLNFGRIEGAKSFNKKCFKGLIIVGIVSLFTIFINPYFIDGVIYPFKTLSNEFINENIQEFQPFSLDTGYEILGFVYAISIIIMHAAQNKKLKLMDLLLILGTIFMSILAIRYMSLFVICSAVMFRYLPGLQENGTFNFTKIICPADKKIIKYSMGVFILALSVSLFVSCIINYKLDMVPENTYPVAATKYLKANLKESDRIFNIYEWGGYLMLNDIKVYIDSRCDLYTEEYNSVTIATDYSKLIDANPLYEGIISRYDLNVFMIHTGSLLDTLLAMDENFYECYSDSLCVIYRKVNT